MNCRCPSPYKNLSNHTTFSPFYCHAPIPLTFEKCLYKRQATNFELFHIYSILTFVCGWAAGRGGAAPPKP
jgi:hypothetical protein